MLYCYDKSEWSRELHMYVTRTYPMFGMTDAQIDSEYNSAARSYRNYASMNRDHAKFLERDILPLLNTPLVPVESLVKPAKPVDGKVNVIAGTIEGAFRTKAAQKSALEAISREYEKTRRVIQDAILSIEPAKRDASWNDIYHVMPFDLHNYRAKHGVQILEQFPHMIAAVTECARLFALRTEVKAKPVQK
jgi:hypothetical protein